ncbi:MAG: ZIP family metal transporter [Candidatus Woesearchaeota archaeon]
MQDLTTLLWILASTFIISIIAFIGIITLILKDKALNKVIYFLVALSAGALMGGAFFHLMPEALELAEEITKDAGGHSLNVFIFLMIGFVLFFLIEKVLHWRHCHKGHCEIHTFAYMNLVGDAVHNFIDGLIIAASFIVDIHLGIITSFAIALHEIPQEIGDFGVLIHGGFSKTKALFMNFLTALTAILGGIAGFFLSGYLDNSMMFLLPFAAGGFIYIAASDLIPEIRKELQFKKYLISFGVFLLGILIMYGMKFVGHAH